MDFTQKIKKNLIPCSPETISVGIFSIYTNYLEIQKDLPDSYLVISGEPNHNWKQSLLINQFEIVEELITKLDSTDISTLIIDSVDNIEGDLRKVIESCTVKGINLRIVAGINAFDTYYNFNKLLKAVGTSHWNEESRSYVSEEKPDSLYKQAMTRAQGVCEVCESPHLPELHHIIFGRGRKRQKECLDSVIILCYDCHRGNNGVHSKDGRGLDIKLKQDLQKIFMSQGYSEEETRQMMGNKLY